MVLAGGLGRRLGGVDKGWVDLAGRPLIVRVLERFAPQVAEVLISANRNVERYTGFGHSVVADQLPGFVGPLAGLHASLALARFDLACTVPCDTPFLPLDLVERLHCALEHEGAAVAVARAGGRVHPVFCLCRRSVRSDLDTYLRAGHREARAWYVRLPHVEVDFDDQPDGFRNVNTPEELAGLSPPSGEP